MDYHDKSYTFINLNTDSNTICTGFGGLLKLLISVIADYGILLTAYLAYSIIGLTFSNLDSASSFCFLITIYLLLNSY